MHVKTLNEPYPKPEISIHSIHTLTPSEEVHESILKNSKVILLDHHSPTNPKITMGSVIQIIDHHKVVDKRSVPLHATLIIEMVSSASTLVALEIIKHGSNSGLSEMDKFSLRLLFAPIILDSSNLEAAITQENDIKCIKFIQEELNISLPFRQGLYNTLLVAKDDVTGLSSHELLYKDLKFVTDDHKEIKVAIPFFPMRVRVCLFSPPASNVGLFFKLNPPSN